MAYLSYLVSLFSLIFYQETCLSSRFYFKVKLVSGLCVTAIYYGSVSCTQVWLPGLSSFLCSVPVLCHCVKQIFLHPGHAGPRRDERSVALLVRCSDEAEESHHTTGRPKKNLAESQQRSFYLEVTFSPVGFVGTVGS